MRDSPETLIALFASAVPAETAARRLGDWMRSNPLGELEAMSVLTKADNGTLSTQRLGPRETRTGAGIGLLAGALAAATTGGLSLFEGLAAGAAGGGAVGSLFRKDARLSPQTRSRIAQRLSPGGAAVVVVVPTRQAAAVIEKLVEYGGAPDDAGTAHAPAPTGAAKPAPASL